MTKRRNVLFIIMDQFRADLIHGDLAAHIDLPNIRALQTEGVTFTNFFSVTNPCGPARASVLTGLYAMNHRSIRNGTPLPGHLTNLGKEARKVGFDPMLFGYTDTTQDPRHHHENDPAVATEEMVMPGFRELLEMRFMESFPWRADLKAKGYDLPDYANFYEPVPAAGASKSELNDPAFYAAKDSDSAFLTNELIKQLSVRTEQPWFAHATYIRPHPPLVAPEPYNRMYDGAKLPLPARLATPEQEAEVHPFMGPAMDYCTMDKIVRGHSEKLDRMDDDAVQTLRAIYLGLATEVDANIGRVITFLKDSGQYDDTLIVLMADHGEMLGDHHMWGKQHVYDSAYRVPLIIRDPAQSAQHGTQVDAMVEAVDIAPTLLDLIGAEIPRAMNGASLRPFLEGRSPAEWRDHAFMELDISEPDHDTIWQRELGLSLREANLSILRERKFKLVHFDGGLPPLLFDLENDPKELQNLAADPAHTTTLLRLTQKLLNHRMRHADHSLTDIKISRSGVFVRPTA